MKLTEQIRKRLSDYQFDSKKSLRQVYQEMESEFGRNLFGYETLRAFWKTETQGSGQTLNQLDEFLTEKGYD